MCSFLMPCSQAIDIFRRKISPINSSSLLRMNVQFDNGISYFIPYTAFFQDRFNFEANRSQCDFLIQGHQGKY